MNPWVSKDLCLGYGAFYKQEEEVKSVPQVQVTNPTFGTD